MARAIDSSDSARRAIGNAYCDIELVRTDLAEAMFALNDQLAQRHLWEALVCLEGVEEALVNAPAAKVQLKKVRRIRTQLAKVRRPRDSTAVERAYRTLWVIQDYLHYRLWEIHKIRGPRDLYRNA